MFSSTAATFGKLVADLGRLGLSADIGAIAEYTVVSGALGARMPEPIGVSRRLVAVFAADVEGYSRLMGADEVGALKGLTERRTLPRDYRALRSQEACVSPVRRTIRYARSCRSPLRTLVLSASRTFKSQSGRIRSARQVCKMQPLSRQGVLSDLGLLRH